MSTNRAIPAAHTKLRRLCAEAAARRGTLITFAKVAEILGLSRGRITQMFGIQSPSAEGGLAPATLGRLVEAFRAEAVPVTIDLMQSPLDTFEAAFAPPSTPPPSAAPRPVPDDPPSPDWLPGHAETFTGEPDAPETALAALAVHPAVPDNFFAVPNNPWEMTVIRLVLTWNLTGFRRLVGRFLGMACHSAEKCEKA